MCVYIFFIKLWQCGVSVCIFSSSDFDNVGLVCVYFLHQTLTMWRWCVYIFFIKLWQCGISVCIVFLHQTLTMFFDNVACYSSTHRAPVHSAAGRCGSQVAAYEREECHLLHRHRWTWPQGVVKHVSVMTFSFFMCCSKSSPFADLPTTMFGA